MLAPPDFSKRNLLGGKACQNANCESGEVTRCSLYGSWNLTEDLEFSRTNTDFVSHVRALSLGSPCRTAPKVTRKQPGPQHPMP